LPILYHLAGRNGPVSSADLWRGFLHYLPCWIAVYASTTLACVLADDVAAPTQLIVGGGVGLAVAVGAALAFERPRTTLRYAVGTLTAYLAGRPAWR
jgi:hypothetical protein